MYIGNEASHEIGDKTEAEASRQLLRCIQHVVHQQVNKTYAQYNTK